LSTGMSFLRRNSRALARTKAIIIILVVIGAVGVSAYLFNAIVAGGGYPPFCSGYPSGGNCHANYSYDFTLTVNYSGSWSVSWRGFHNSEISSPSSTENYTGGTYSGSGSNARTVALSGDNFHFLTLCATASKLDRSNSTLTLTSTGSNSTSLPYGSTYYCGGVAP
jgi:hypothetical protein